MGNKSPPTSPPSTCSPKGPCASHRLRFAVAENEQRRRTREEEPCRPAEAAAAGAASEPGQPGQSGKPGQPGQPVRLAPICALWRVAFALVLAQQQQQQRGLPTGSSCI